MSLTVPPFSFDPSVDRLLRRSDHFHYFKATRGELHGNISVDTIIYLEEPKKGGLLHLDPPMRTSGITRFGFLSLPSQMAGANLRFCSPRPRQRWVPEFEYDGNGEVVIGSSEEGDREGSPPTDWYMKRVIAQRYRS